MQTEALERHDHGSVNVELCFACAGIWFDRMASVELAPAAVISLFGEIHARRDVARQPVAGRLGCPRCGDALVLSYDMTKSGRFSYFRCARGDGRFTPFFQFLREKQFIRDLTPAETQRVRAQARQMNCSQCGAPVDLELGTECTYCHAPLSLLDPDAVDAAVRLWSEAQDRQHRVPVPGAVATAIRQIQPVSIQHAHAATADHGQLPSWSTRNLPGSVDSDLIGSAIQVLGRLFDSIK